MQLTKHASRLSESAFTFRLVSHPFQKFAAAAYKDIGLVVVGVHAPEFAFEKNLNNVQHAVQDMAITYPVVLDKSFTIWKAFNNQYWPAHYFVDANGKIRGHHFGEGNYAESEQLIRRLLLDAGAKNLPPYSTEIEKGTGMQAAADSTHILSPETYIGYKRAENFVSPTGFTKDASGAYTVPTTLKRNQWGLAGNWHVDAEKATLAGASGKIDFRFYARDLHLVMGPAGNGKPIRFRVLLDGVAHAANHGMDIDADGVGAVKEERLYQLIRQSGDVDEHTFSIEFLDEGAQAFSFTFG